MGPRKRTAREVIDPISDVSPSKGRHAKKPYNGGLTASGSQENPMLIDDEEEEEEVDDVVVDPHEREYQYELYGSMPGKIVGVRYYRGYADPGEQVILQREPHNQYDSNAIRVSNLGGSQIGHIPRVLAAKLAPYMDNRLLVIEAAISGEMTTFECPIQLRFYGPTDYFAREHLLTKMKADKLPTADVRQRVRETERKKKEAAKAARAEKAARKKAEASASQAVYAESQLGEFAGGSSQGDGTGREMTLSDILGSSQVINPRNLERAVEDFGVKEADLAAMPQAAQPEALSTELYPFQLQGLQWMLDKESPKLPERGSKKAVQLWQRHPQRPEDFAHVATNYSVREPVLASGGILADDMGLGKTAQVIALIMADKARGVLQDGVADATLILAPVSVMSNWSTQMERHIKKEHALRIMFYHGTRKRKIDPDEIKQYDVVISTYDSVSAEWNSQKNPQLPRKSGLFSVKWRRVILDEGHNIRNPNAKKTIAAWNLMAHSRWVLTGTPIINNLKDLYSLVRFIRLSGGMDRLDVFHGAIIRPVSQGDAHGNRALQLLMGDICLRRKKEMAFVDLRLPELTEYIHRVDFSPDEQEKYDALKEQAKGTLDTYRQDLRGANNNASASYRHLLEVLLRMRQLCNHWALVGEERLATIMSQLSASGVVDLTPENRAALQQMLQLSIESQEDCPVCLDPLRDPVITKCTHTYCTPCIERVIETQHKCPLCRADLDSLPTSTVKPARHLPIAPQGPTPQDSPQDPQDPTPPSSKSTALLSILSASAAQDPTTKTIIFSQWTSFLTLLSPHLAAAGYTFVRIDGTMSAAARDAALHALDTDPRTTILLASLAVSSVGLNLVAANHVILSDSWWAPAIEDQAVDRVHRLGQTRETRVWRLVVRGSVEERVLGIQEDKRRLMGLAFSEREGEGRGRAGRGRGRGVGMADLERLLGSQTQGETQS